MGSFDSNSVKDLITSYQGIDVKIEPHLMRDSVVITIKSRHCDLYTRHEIDNLRIRNETSSYCFKILNNIINDFMLDLVRKPPTKFHPKYKNYEIFRDELNDYRLPTFKTSEKIKNENAGIF